MVDMYQLDSQDLDHAVVRNIIFIKSATTTNNLVLGKDTKEKIISIYGNPNNDYGSDSTMTYLHYNDKGISFGVDNKDNKIRIIDIYKINGFSENLSLNTMYYLIDSKK